MKRPCSQCGKPTYVKNVRASNQIRALCSPECREIWFSIEARVGRGYRVNSETGCWEWLGGVGSGGYGTMTINKVFKAAHRASYEVFIGEIPDGMLVCHTCDNRRCVNPEHLWLGTYSDNLQDCVDKGRRFGGNKKGMEGTLHRTPEVVHEIRRLLTLGTMSLLDIAEKTGVKKKKVVDIRDGRCYAYIK